MTDSGYYILTFNEEQQCFHMETCKEYTHKDNWLVVCDGIAPYTSDFLQLQLDTKYKGSKYTYQEVLQMLIFVMSRMIVINENEDTIIQRISRSVMFNSHN